MNPMKFITRLWGRYGFRRKLILVFSDTPPMDLSSRNIYLAREDGENWAVAFKCPCGCKDRIELQLIAEASPNWHLANDHNKHPTLHPSIWRTTGCKSHFWLRKGRIHWC